MDNRESKTPAVMLREIKIAELRARAAIAKAQVAARHTLLQQRAMTRYVEIGPLYEIVRCGIRVTLLLVGTVPSRSPS